MELYTKTSYQLGRTLTLNYSTSFGKSSKLFSKDIRDHIYAIYGLVRVADEIVDTYKGNGMGQLLDELEAHTLQALKTGFSPNPLVHAFATTARQYGIKKDLVRPFFKSMRMDLSPQTYDQQKYETYIYGSAEVVGLMCLKVFVADDAAYAKLEAPASRLGAAYQKVNFLRDIAADSEGLGRWYFPIGSAATFDEKTKRAIIADIDKDFAVAKKAIPALPESSQKAVLLSYEYYSRLLQKIKETSASRLLQERIRITNTKKIGLFIKTASTRSPRA